jgi:hypothetical protein
MSHVADIILTCDLGEEDGDDNWPAINHINEYLSSENKGVLTNIGKHAGGHKALQVEVFGGAFNYLDWEGFAQALRTAPWESPENVVLLVQDEHDEILKPVWLNPKHDGYNSIGETFQALLTQ